MDTEMETFRNELAREMTAFGFDNELRWAENQWVEYWDTLYQDTQNVHQAALHIIHDHRDDA